MSVTVTVRSFSRETRRGSSSAAASSIKEAGSALVILTDYTKQSLDDVDLASRLGPVREACQRCDRAGINYVISQNFGGPGETSDTVDAKLAFLRQIKPALANLRVGMRISPDSELKKGLITDESDLIRPYFYIAEPVRDWIVDRVQAKAEANPRWNVL